MLRDEVQVGDRVFFYHSNAKPPAIMGTAEVVKAGLRRPHAVRSRTIITTTRKPTRTIPPGLWSISNSCRSSPQPVDREQLAGDETTKNMGVLARGSRLSIQPVTAAEWKAVHKLAGVKDK